MGDNVEATTEVKTRKTRKDAGVRRIDARCPDCGNRVEVRREPGSPQTALCKGPEGCGQIWHYVTSQRRGEYEELLASNGDVVVSLAVVRHGGRIADNTGERNGD
jgi:hypothetical protein